MQAGARRHDAAAGGELEKPGSKPVSLRARALRLLARRDYSYVELENKLAPHATEAGELSALLADLQRRGWLSEARLAEQVVRKASARFGARRIVQQLQERGIDEQHAARVRSELQASELQRARAVWAKRFGRLPADLREFGRQARFLEQRGFDSDVIRRVLRGAQEE
jgi:regulatory protein